jgi:BirA family biotin operon repressor/biotin-[acetyl-CoA-carboxylase] ligase
MVKKFNPSLAKALDMLADGQYHDGDTLGQALGMTRSAVWKMLKKLVEYGIHIKSLKGKGYALLDPFMLLDPDKIKQALQHDNVEVLVLETVDSTNQYLKKIKHDKAIKFVIAEQQTQGKGRMNRDWYSPFGQNIYLSCLYPFKKDISELSGLSLVISLAIVAAIKSVSALEPQVKWPNDIMLDNKKLSGSLIEIQAETHGACHAIIGVGVNINMLVDSHQLISQAWTSLRQASGHYVDRNQCCVKLVNSIMVYLQRFEEKGFADFIDEWVETDCLTNKSVSVSSVSGTISGEVTGINEQGHLLMRLSDGTVRSFSSGDTSIIKHKQLVAE